MRLAAILLYWKSRRESIGRLWLWFDQALCQRIKRKFKGHEISAGIRMDGLLAAATHPASGDLSDGYRWAPWHPSNDRGARRKDIALANKETLVTAGHIIMPLAKKCGVSILPVDSEHSAIFQSLQGNAHNKIKKILLTASGGPFRGKTYEELEHVTLEDALKHPNWSMGKKITIDSATMVNKGLEVMEAKWLFGVKPSQIEVVVHPQSILHSAVMYEDGAVIGQMGTPDMRLPILYALFYPNRRMLYAEELDLFKVGSLTFERPDRETFYGLSLAYDALDAGGNVPTVFNAANERAVAKFLDGKISFIEIPEIIAASMEEIYYKEDPTLEEILDTEAATYEYIESRW